MRLVVFDLDGTLVDSRKDLADSINAMLEEMGRPPLPVAEVTTMVGEGARLLVERALARSGLPREEAAQRLPRFVDLYAARLLNHTAAYDGIPGLLQALHGRVRLAVLTNKPADASVRILEGLGLARFFDAVAGGDSPLPRKPDPAALLDLARRFGVTPAETLMVGDSRIDLETARAAGVRICLVSYGFGFRFEPSDLTGVPVAATAGEVGEIVSRELTPDDPPLGRQRAPPRGTYSADDLNS